MAERKSGITTTIDVASLPKKPKKKKRTRRGFTDAQKVRVLAKIKADMARGLSRRLAAKKAGVVQSMAARWMKDKSLAKPAARYNGHAKDDAVMITLLIQGQPLTVSLEDAIRIQQGLGQLLRFQR